MIDGQVTKIWIAKKKHNILDLTATLNLSHICEKEEKKLLTPTIYIDNPSKL